MWHRLLNNTFMPLTGSRATSMPMKSLMLCSFVITGAHQCTKLCAAVGQPTSYGLQYTAIGHGLPALSMCTAKRIRYEKQQGIIVICLKRAYPATLYTLHTFPFTSPMPFYSNASRNIVNNNKCCTISKAVHNRCCQWSVLERTISRSEPSPENILKPHAF